MESDYAKHGDAEHLDTINKLETRVRDLEGAAGKRATVQRALDACEAQIAGERIAHEGALLEAARAAEKKLAVALAGKDRAIAHRDAKLAGLPAMQAALCAGEAALRQMRMRCSAAEREAAERETAERALQLEVESLTAINDERLARIRSLSGRLGGRPQESRSTQELTECLASTAYKCEAAMASRVGDAIGKVGTPTEISVDAIMDAIKGGGTCMRCGSRLLCGSCGHIGLTRCATNFP
jgi:hypothetical protein